MRRWKHFRDRIGAGRTARTDLDADPGVEPAERIAARRTAVTPGHLETATTPGPHVHRGLNLAARGLKRSHATKPRKLSPG